jgi:CubicO group peptidase (beta-lactamase class C family)
VFSASRLAQAIRSAGYSDATAVAVGTTVASGDQLFAAQGSFDSESVAYAASVAKQFTAACAALLERDGDLDCDATIAPWLPELPSWSERVRVRHLIHHTAGLPDVWPRMKETQRTPQWTSPAFLAALAATPELDHAPGSVYAYSNVGYICLATIIERISASTLDSFARARIFKPLGMTRSTFWTGPSPTPPTAVAPAAEPTQPAPLSAGDGGLWTSVSELLRWNEAVMSDALGITARTHTPGSLDDGTRLDYAWGVRVSHASGQTVQSHGGEYGNATAKLIRLPNGVASLAALAADNSVERMITLGDIVQSWLIQESVIAP